MKDFVNALGAGSFTLAWKASDVVGMVVVEVSVTGKVIAVVRKPCWAPRRAGSPPSTGARPGAWAVAGAAAMQG